MLECIHIFKSTSDNNMVSNESLAKRSTVYICVSVCVYAHTYIHTCMGMGRGCVFIYTYIHTKFRATKIIQTKEFFTDHSIIFAFFL